MKKKFLVPALALSVIGGGIAGSVLNTNALAAKSDQNSTVEVSDEAKVDVKTGKVLKEENDKKVEKGEKEDKNEKEDNDGEISDKEEQKQLEKQATITAKESESIALKEVKGQVTDTELEDEDGVVVYSVEIKGDQSQKYDVKIDAKTGKVLKVEKDDEKDDGEENDD
ncbi:hypothetical protein F7731_16140 [Cytobacillus depressus]|uniref:PepSY domain-containing protein n=1 Tax=Cytobacillus depressus TaxID=1602942 RepID=A0A6L3V4F0_9BACI|nr:PepSY domain-containing protein [Cytobacillus depressus]KAB2333072.1 hypothetical protein F7731_16140 [Cytobacillus depressus]